MPKDGLDREIVEKTEPKKEGFSLLKGFLLLSLVLITVILTWVWNLEDDQQKIYLRYLGFEQATNERVIYREPTVEKQREVDLPHVINKPSSEVVAQKEESIPHVELAKEVKSQAILRVLSDVDFVAKKDHLDPVGKNSTFPVEKKAGKESTTQEEVNIVLQPVRSQDQQAAILLALQHLSTKIGELSQDLSQNQKDQVMLHQASIARQKLDLHTRLKWILIPSNNWVHMHLYWQDISSLIMITDGQRAQASAQADLARQHMQRILEWRESMRSTLHELQLLAHDGEQSLIPSEGDPWLVWLSGHFQLNHVSKKNSVAFKTLQHLIQEMLLLGDGQWPDEQQWQVVDQQIKRQLPEAKQIKVLNFEKAKEDRQAMKALAIKWLGE